MPSDSSESEGLEQRLLHAALERLAETPAEGLSIRLIAQELGVSHQAPYVHFGSKRGFLAAVAGVGLREAAGAASQAVQAAGTDPRTRLHALADSYLGFIRTRPHLHDLAYGTTVAKSDHPLLQQAAIEYWNLLQDAVAACQPSTVTEGDVLRRVASAWGAAYGLARLAAFHQIPLSVPASADELVHATLDALIDGWQEPTASASH
ncbi:TetR/AcrR family transcriptional regulator [Raineyella antarctica]|uniref:TetR/AcrR family transcriptional regulator n=1 Tax=Raineyella antarctica TaxID=1577474 RepID=UPI001C3160CC|nr:TetR/AcrR family transcriptional regulator [Raineyella antarctica]